MGKYGEFIECVDNELIFDGVKCTDLAKEYGTPLFVISENTLRASIRTFHDAFQSRYPGEVLTCVGLKSNYGLAMRRIVATEKGAGGEAFGLGELYSALVTGTDPEKIVMNGCNKLPEILRAAIDAGITVNLDTYGEVCRVESLAKEMGKKLNVAVRCRLPLKKVDLEHYVDPRYASGVDGAEWERTFKFGNEPNQALKSIEHCLKSPYLNLVGAMYHGGIPRRVGFHVEELEELLEVLKMAKDKTGWEPEMVDIGGGFTPVRYGNEFIYPSLERYAADITDVFIRKCAEYQMKLPKLILEPGRFCVEKAGMFLTRVGLRKEDHEVTNRKWVYVDGNTNEMGDPFDAQNRFHYIVVANNTSAPDEEVVDVCGQLCSADDVLAKQRKISAVKEGDLLAFLDMGAYMESFGNNANAMPRSATVIVSNGRAALARRRETVQDIFARDVIPYWLLGVGK
ncbi:diaminopimelate decarboxylase family protein [Anaerotruncus rubiinfantis]|uniref:diaminopimelate decarboxylase family protein n=1 Tax=Anaerotruncus rubiinfantis TaxID=1720200 RepID=UPI0018973D22|nr:hypothetical protein [Anaerotruncus rubiinfantis]